VDLFLLTTAGLAGYAAWAYFHPFRDCPRCRRSGRNRGSTGRRWGNCSRCHGTRQVQTFGARLLHRSARSVAQRRGRR
jgi:hypothetical protein